MVKSIRRVIVSVVLSLGRFSVLVAPIVVELSAVAVMAAGVALIYVPAALILVGAVFIFAIERMSKAAAVRSAREARTRKVT